MSRAHFEVAVAMHRKVLTAGNGATGLWFRLTCWCREHLTDGHVPRPVLKMFATDDAEIQRAIDAGLLDVRSDGEHWVHDYLDHNYTRRTVEKIRKDKRKAGAEGGKQSAKQRRSKVPSTLLDVRLHHAPTLRISGSQDLRISDPQIRTEEITPPAASVVVPPESTTKKTSAHQVFDHWLACYRQLHPKAASRAPAKKELQPAVEALGRGHSVADCCLAIDGLFASDWHRGANDRAKEFLGIHLALKPENLENFRLAALGDSKAGSPRPFTKRDVPTAEELANADQAAVKASLAAAREALQRFRTEPPPEDNAPDVAAVMP